MKHLNPIVCFEIDLVKVDNNNKRILKTSERFLIEKYASLQECSKSVRNRIKRAKTEHYHGVVHSIRHSGKKEFLIRF